MEEEDPRYVRYKDAADQAVWEETQRQERQQKDQEQKRRQPEEAET